MQRAFNQSSRAVACVVAAFCLLSEPAAGQRLLDLPVRTWAGADAVATGAVAAFWNPAGAGILTRRGEVLVVDVLAPEPTGLGGFALAGAWQIDSATTFALGYHHVGVDGILRTGDSPLAGEATPLDLGEDGLALAAARRVNGVFHAGIVLRYLRASEIVADRGIVEFGAGVLARPRLSFAPVLGGAVRSEEGGLAWSAGVDVTPFSSAGSEWRAGASWGAEDSPLHMGPAHRLALAGAWRDYLSVSAGMANEADAEARTWRPVLAATLRLSRYALSVMREDMANDFGALHAFRFTIAF